MEGNQWCDIPCYDLSFPKSYKISVSYLPGENELRKMFLEYDYNKINNLTLHSNYSIQLFYDSEGKEIHSFSFGFRTGWQIPHKFSLTVKFENGEIINYSIKIGDYDNRREECIKCQITKLNDNEIRVEGTRSYEEYPYLEVWWKDYEK